MYIYVRERRVDYGVRRVEGFVFLKKTRRKKEFRTDARVENKYTHQEYEQTKRSVL